jgi:predicted GIY-YIG superfamily endonuclease
MFHVEHAFFFACHVFYKMKNPFFRCVSATLLLVAFSPNAAQEKRSTSSKEDKQQPAYTVAEKKKIKAVVQSAFTMSHNGYSSDEVILDDDLNKAFIKQCSKTLPDVPPAVFNWTLINLRKAGKLEGQVTKRKKSVDAGELKHVAEIAARKVQDKHKVSSDRIMTDPKLRAEFNATASRIAPDADLYQVRKIAFLLRKTRRLRPELITRLADWGREITEHRADEIAKDFARIPEKPGIYIFRDKTGYLYIGEAINLRARLKTHLTDSDRKTLSSYLAKAGFKNVIVEVHSFDKDSRAKEVSVRRAYESELIRSRKPQLNVRE